MMILTDFIQLCVLIPFHIGDGVGINAADVQFDCDSQKMQCLSEPVQHQCTVGGSLLVWLILNETMNSLGSRSYTTVESESPFNPLPGAATAFSTDLSSDGSPLTSNISYTVQESINGYTIRCQSSDMMEDCTIDIAGTCVSLCVHDVT